MPMELTNIRELVEKYWNGDTTLEEEKVLRDYLANEEVPADLKKEAALFRYYQAQTRFRKLDDQFEEKITRRIQRKQPLQWWTDYRSFIRVAAAVLMLIVAAILLKTEWLDTPSEADPVAVSAEDTYEDPQLAYEQTKEALMLVSSLMNEGAQHIEELETFSEAQETVKTQIR